jgi:hypothetical protein
MRRFWNPPETLREEYDVQRAAFELLPTDDDRLSWLFDRIWQQGVNIAVAIGDLEADR